MNDQEFDYLKQKIHRLVNLDLNGYKTTQIRRRLQGYVERIANGDVQAYCRILQDDVSKRRELVDFLAINVSEFFRDAAYFTFVKDQVIPELRKLPGKIKVWSAACSCGQEPYTLAMLMEEYLGPDRYRILATDIDTSALNTARGGGPYLNQDIRNVPPLLLKKYFTTKDEGRWINTRLARNIDFRMHNLQSDRYERGFDLIVCRNVIIYFAESVRQQIFSSFHRSLNENGMLFIGGSEAILRPGDYGFKIMRPSFYRKLPLQQAAPAAPALSERR